MTVPKNTNRAKQAIATATDVRCYSLSNGFSGEPMIEKPVIWKEGKLVEVSQPERLTWELNQLRSKLIAGENGNYTIRVHSNLWYDFKSQAGRFAEERKTNPNYPFSDGMHFCSEHSRDSDVIAVDKCKSCYATQPIDKFASLDPFQHRVPCWVPNKKLLWTVMECGYVLGAKAVN